MAYTRPIRNPLRRSLSGVRGLGDTCQAGYVTGPDGNCIVDAGTSATVVVTPQGTTVTGQGSSTGYTATTPATSPSLTDWLNANSSTLLWVGGVALGVMLLSRLAR